MAVGIRRKLLYEEVVAALYEMIDRQEVELGEQFPSERELVERWNISRNVLREAFHVLEGRGLVSSRQGQGRFLRALPEQAKETEDESRSKNLERYSLVEIYQTRQCLECKAVELIAEHANEQDLKDLDRAYQEMCRKFNENQNTSGEFEMHRLYVQKSQNAFLEQLTNSAFKTTFELMSGTFMEVLNRHTIADSILDHGEILRALHNRDGEKAKAIMSAHIQHTIDMLEKKLPIE